jgi:hypothetical protein
MQLPAARCWHSHRWLHLQTAQQCCRPKLRVWVPERELEQVLEPVPVLEPARVQRLELALRLVWVSVP